MRKPAIANHRPKPAAWGRRSFLAGAGAATLLAPFAHHLFRGGRARAQDDLPQRLLVVFSPNGTIAEEWTPDGGETDFTFRRILAPLERHRSKVMVLSGIDMLSTNSGPGDGHQKGMGHILTGVPLLPGDVAGGCDSCPPVSWSSGASIDQAIARRICENSRLPSLELGCRVSNAENVWTRMSYTAASAPLPPQNDPARAFADVFGDPDLDPEEVRRRLALQQSILDHNLADFERSRRLLGGADRERFDRHMSTIRDIEARLGASTSVGAACRRPDVPATIDFRSTDAYPQVVDLQSEIMAMTFACDITRVGSIMWTNSVGNVPFPWLGFADNHHDLSHEGDSNGEAIGKITAINEWYGNRFAELLDKLDAVPEGEGTMLDHTLVVWVNELGRGNSHTLRNIPFVLAGNIPDAEGLAQYRMGRHLRFDGDRTHNDLWTTLGQSFGLDVERWGDPAFSNGVLPGLLVG